MGDFRLMFDSPTLAYETWLFFVTTFFAGDFGGDFDLAFFARGDGFYVFFFCCYKLVLLPPTEL